VNISRSDWDPTAHTFAWGCCVECESLCPVKNKKEQQQNVNYGQHHCFIALKASDAIHNNIVYIKSA